MSPTSRGRKRRLTKRRQTRADVDPELAGAALPEAAREGLDGAAAELGAEFPVAYHGPGPDEPSEALLAGLEDVSDPAELQEILDRRMFALPYRGTRIGDEGYPELDAGDPDERRLLIIGEHPEYHDVLDDPFSEELVDGTSPRAHVAIHEVVANQLWDGEPPEAWQAAQRLTAQGVERHNVLHALGSVVANHLHSALSGVDVDLDAYRRDLDALGPEGW